MNFTKKTTSFHLTAKLLTNPTHFWKIISEALFESLKVLSKDFLLNLCITNQYNKKKAKNFLGFFQKIFKKVGRFYDKITCTTTYFNSQSAVMKRKSSS